jgi:hypothetical protein
MGIREILTKDKHKVAIEVEHRITDEAMEEGLIHINLHTACTMVAQPTTTTKIALDIWRQKRKCTKIPSNLLINPRPEKSITPCNGLPTPSNTPHPTLLTFHYKPIITTKPNP